MSRKGLGWRLLGTVCMVTLLTSGMWVQAANAATKSDVETFNQAITKILRHANKLSNKNELAGGPHGLSIVGRVKDGILWVMTTNLPRDEIDKVFSELQGLRRQRRNPINIAMPRGVIPDDFSHKKLVTGKGAPNVRFEALIYGGMPSGMVSMFEADVSTLMTLIQFDLSKAIKGMGVIIPSTSVSNAISPKIEKFNKKWVPRGIFAHIMMGRHRYFYVFLTDEVDEEKRIKDFEHILQRSESEPMDLNSEIPPMSPDQAFKNLDADIPFDVLMITALIYGVSDALPMVMKPGWFAGDIVKRIDSVLNATLAKTP